MHIRNATENITLHGYLSARNITVTGGHGLLSLDLTRISFFDNLEINSESNISERYLPGEQPFSSLRMKSDVGELPVPLNVYTNFSTIAYLAIEHGGKDITFVDQITVYEFETGTDYVLFSHTDFIPAIKLNNAVLPSYNTSYVENAVLTNMTWGTLELFVYSIGGDLSIKGSHSDTPNQIRTFPLHTLEGLCQFMRPLFNPFHFLS